MSTAAEKETAGWRYPLCPHCLDGGLMVDPREKSPTATVIEQICWTHLIIEGKIHPLISRPTPTQED